eukprot:TRINITY_DN18542_c0_g1_i1.p1 TRINITY_DN18542_c0_g1~~TRINITY_DN18542_c0_g1_i1.p1  ORF type:complete len:594 (+),score=84.83 TRINITY_DN18542_c0_g1_i1:66-1847(+)
MAATRSASMNDLRVPAATWAGELQAYEREKRRVVDEGLVNNRQVRVTGPQVRLQERCFDPLLQRYRSNETELRQRTLEEKERVAHLNRARDISILRGQPFNLITHESKLENLAPGVDPMRMGHEKPRNKDAGRPGAAMPDTSLDYNIISNIPQEHHHWARPEARPHIAEKKPRERVIPAFLVKDFNIVTNRYSDGHHERVARDKHLNLLEASKKYAKANRFDPVTQLFNDPRDEERARTCDDAREVEITMRAQNQVPPAYKGRQSEFYDVLSHQIHDPNMIKFYDDHETERKARYKNRYIVEHNFHKQDMKGDHIKESRKIARIAPERYAGDEDRGYDLVTNQDFGRLHHQKTLHHPATMPRQTPWDKVQAGHNAPQLTNNASNHAADLGYFQSLSDMYYADRCQKSQTIAAPESGRRPLSTSASAPALGTEHPGQRSTTPSRHGESSRRADTSRGGRVEAPQPPGRTAPPRRLAQAVEMPKSPAYSASSSRREERATVLAGARAPSEASFASSAKRVRSSAPSGAGYGQQTNPAPARSASMGATALGPTMRRPTPAVPAMASMSMGMASAPPAPNIPGSPGKASAYSRPSYH